MEAEDSFLETLARYSFPIPLLTGSSSRRGAESGKKETIGKLSDEVGALRAQVSHLETENQSLSRAIGKADNAE